MRRHLSLFSSCNIRSVQNANFYISNRLNFFGGFSFFKEYSICSSKRLKTTRNYTIRHIHISFVKSMLTIKERLEALRTQLKEHNIDAYIIPTADAHFCEYPPESDARRKYISGFTGSAGTAVVTLNEAYLWTDGRYFTQAERQLDSTYWKLMKDGLPDTPAIETWLKENTEVYKIGYDPVITSIPFYKKMTLKLKEAKRSKQFVPINHNLVDQVWNNDSRPLSPASTVFLLNNELTGCSTRDKLANIRAQCVQNGVDSCVLSLLDDVAWVTNMRGADIEYCPVFLAYMFITDAFCRLYINPERLTSESTVHLLENSIEIRPYAAIFDDVTEKFQRADGLNKLWLDADANMRLYHCVKHPEEQVLVQLSPAQLPKAIKTSAELCGMKEAHIKDAMAEITFLAWLETLAAAPKETETLESYTEWTLSEKLDSYRFIMPDNVGLSFNTISSIGPNASVIHYSAEKDSSLSISHDLYLLDSGGQYRQGTTDVTRTIHLGCPTDEQKLCFTYVLKGHLQLARQKFPKGTKGPQLDILARQWLWNNGLDYLHGTGHGVGSFLNVHEGPQRISSALKSSASDVALAPGMVISNEPGYYKDNEFGIRIENLIYVKQEETLNPAQRTPFYGFEDLTLIPHQKKMIVIDLLTDEELEQFNAYHSRVWSVISPRLEECACLPNISLTLKWLNDATSPLTRA